MQKSKFKNRTNRHCEERSDEAISTTRETEIATAFFKGLAMTLHQNYGRSLFGAGQAWIPAPSTLLGTGFAGMTVRNIERPDGERVRW